MENSEQFEDLQELDFILPKLSVETEQTEDVELSVAPHWPEDVEFPARKPQPEHVAEQQPKTRTREKKAVDSWQKTVLLYLHDIIYLLSALIIVSLLLLRVVVVSGTSMCRTLLDGDYLLVLSNVFYQEPKAGDIVVISKESFDNGDPIVKRVIATEGQWVDIDFDLGIVYVDGVALDEPYTNTATNTQEGMTFPLYVEENCIFVLGDNRNVSRDSRSTEIGLIDEQEVIGKVIFLFMPGTNGKDVFGNPKEPRDWSRIGVVE